MSLAYLTIALAGRALARLSVQPSQPVPIINLADCYSRPPPRGRVPGPESDLFVPFPCYASTSISEHSDPLESQRKGTRELFWQWVAGCRLAFPINSLVLDHVLVVALLPSSSIQEIQSFVTFALCRLLHLHLSLPCNSLLLYDDRLTSHFYTYPTSWCMGTDPYLFRCQRGVG